MIPTYNVVVLGSSGSGKTVFLASMDSKLSVQSKDIGFALSIPLQQRKLLAQKFEEVAFGIEWPQGTREVSEWQFTCKVNSANSSTFAVCNFNYLDYAGGIITDADPQTLEQTSDFEFKIRTADALLGMIDGHKVCAELDSNIPSPPGTTLFRDLQNMIPPMSEQTSVPVHFIITKWDLLHGKYSLEDVRNCLLQIDIFRNLVQNRVEARTPVRLIPVSSVGMGFAELQQDGTMKKVAGVLPKPFQVEMPVSHVLMDRLKMHIKDLVEREEKLKAQPSGQVTPEYSFWAAVKKAGAGFLQSVQRRLPADYQFTEAVFVKAIDHLAAESRKAEEVAVDKAERIRREREDSLKQIRDSQTATEYAMDNFRYLMNRLSHDFPESDLSRI